MIFTLLYFTFTLLYLYFALPLLYFTKQPKELVMLCFLHLVSISFKSSAWPSTVVFKKKQSSTSYIEAVPARAWSNLTFHSSPEGDSPIPATRYSNTPQGSKNLVNFCILSSFQKKKK